MLTRNTLFLGPILFMFGFGFALPMGMFLISSLLEIGSASAIFHAIVATARSTPMVQAMITTNGVALVVTLTCLLLCYPVAYYLCIGSRLSFSLIIFCIVVPYFTSVIVRTYSWMLILGRNGIINSALMDLGIISEPLALMYNRTGVIIGMTYILMPYMVLTLFATMKSIDPGYVRAARSLGASKFYTFSRVYFPLSANGVISGSLIVFILAIGFFITPDLMGGRRDVMVAMLIQRSVEITFDWTTAAIMSLELLIVTLLIYGIYYRLTDQQSMIRS